MTAIRIRAALLAGALVLAGSFSGASAASQITRAFVSNLGANVGFLDTSSRIAAASATTAGVRAFASQEATEQAKVAAMLTIVLPAMSVVASADDGLASGRSVAIDGKPGETALQSPVQQESRQAANGRLPASEDDLARLKSLSGRAFDDFYWQKQLDALSQIESDYRAYIKSGDDPALVALAKSELPNVLRRLKALSQI